MKKSKKKFKGKSGITLVALVVTIVVMLILAGVSLNFILGEQGILNRGKEGVEKYSNHQSNEETMLSETEDWIDEITGAPVKLGKVSVGEKASKNSTINGEEANETNPIIPKGYIAINTETAKWDVAEGPQYNNGLVISDNTTNGNEWVWVPVDASTLAGMYETASSPIAITGGSGKTYISGVETSKYSKGGIISGKTRVLPNDTSSFREPDVVVESSDTSYDAVESYRKTAGFTKTENGTKTTMSLSEMAKTMVNEYETMIASIAKYGGFYIGRYELTANGEKPGATLTESSWYTLYGKCKELEASEKVQTRMIWSCQWDVTCNWIASTNEDKSITDSRSWGNYKDSISPANTGNYEQGVKKDTGSNEAWKANNIYDFAGNCFEWTQEAHRTSNRAGRGGSYGSSGSDGPATNRRTYVPTFSWDSGIRFPSRFNSATMSSRECA